MSTNEQTSTGGFKATLVGILSVFSAVAVLTVLAMLLLIPGEEPAAPVPEVSVDPIMDQFDEYVFGLVSLAWDAANAVPKTYKIDTPEDVPAPDVSGYGTAEEAAELQWLLDAASGLLNGQDTLFTTDTQIRPGTEITYYLDQSILAVCWQQVLDDMIYTIAEVKIAHPSQFIRHVADGDLNSKKLYTTTEMSAQVDAVIAGSGDYFKSRDAGIVVYNGKVERCYGAKQMDTCLVDDQGNLILMPRGSFTNSASVQEFVDANNISFSFAFGPVLIKDGVRCEPNNYGLGEPEGHYARAAICQRDELHYVMVVANGSDAHGNYPDIHMFTGQIEAFGCQQAYALDGGQTGAIVMQHELLNPTEYKNGQRHISDMYFFATAIPKN